MKYEVNAVLLCVINVVFTFVGTFLNSVVIMSICNSQLRRKLCYFMILVLACFDLAVVIVFHPMIILETISRWLYMTSYCSIKVLYLEHLFAFSLTALLTMTLERYLAVVYPFIHENSVTKSRLLAIFVLLQLPFGVPYFAFLNQNLETYIEACLLALIGAVFSVIYFLNYKIFSTVERLRQRVAIPLGTFGTEEENIKVKKHNFSLGKVSTCLLAIVCLSVCYFPTVVICVLKLMRVFDRNDEHDNRTLIVIRVWEDTFLTMNSTLNCLIFFYKNSALRRRGIKIMKKCLCAIFRYHKCMMDTTTPVYHHHHYLVHNITMQA